MKIKNIPQHVLFAVRQRLGAETKNDTSKDAMIERLSPLDLTKKLCGWELGDEPWASRYIHVNKLLESKLQEEMSIGIIGCHIVGCTESAEQINTPIFSSGIYCRKHFDEINNNP